VELESRPRAEKGRLTAALAGCLREGIRPYIRKIGEPHGAGLGKVRCVVEHGCAWLLANKRLDRRPDRLGRIILALLTSAAIFVVANRLCAF
jgi:hypothetical protein